jgi:hypothetical protein
MSANYITKKLTKKDIYNLLPLYKSAFGFNADSKSVTTKFFHKYQTINASFFSSNDITASFYGMITMKAIYNNNTIIIGQSCDSMTHKNHVGKGLFISLAKEVYEYLIKEGVHYVFGFPNKTIYNLRIKKLHWQHSENINVYKIKVKTLPIAKVVKKIPFLKKFYNGYINLAINKHKSKSAFFDNSVIKNNIAGILHDTDYFNYKRTPDKFILKLNGINLWLKIDGFLWVGDFENTSEENFKLILASLKKIAFFLGCNSIVFHFQEGTLNNEILNKFLDIDSQMPLGFVNLTDKYKNVKFKFSGSDFDSW